MLKIKLNAKNTLQSLEKTQKAIADLSDFFQEVVRPRLIKHFQEVFDSRGFGNWRPLAASTIAYKARYYPHNKNRILRRSDRLYQSYINLGHAENISIITKNSITHGTRVPYAVYHEEGTGRIPARRVVGEIVKRDMLSRSFSVALGKWIQRRGGI